MVAAGWKVAALTDGARKVDFEAQLVNYLDGFTLADTKYTGALSSVAVTGSLIAAAASLLTF